MKKILIGSIFFILFIILGILISKNIQATPKLINVYGAIGGGKENFLEDTTTIEIFKKNGLNPINVAWSNNNMLKDELTYTIDSTSGIYDFVFFSDIRFYEYYKLPAQENEHTRLPIKKSEIILNTPIAGIPQNIDSVVPGLKMNVYNTIIDKLKN